MKTRDTYQLKSMLTACLILIMGFATATFAQNPDDQYWSSDFKVTGIGGFALQKYIYATQEHNDNFYIGGFFHYINGEKANAVAYWDGNSWQSMGSGLSSSTGSTIVTALTADGNKIYVGGAFEYADNVEANGFAIWDTANETWSTLGSGPDIGTDGSINSILKVGNKIYIAGNFTTVNGVNADNIAVWDGSNWNAVGSGVNGTVHEIKNINNEIYAVGQFTNAGGNAASKMAKWDGSNWSEFAGGASATVYTIEAIDTSIYVGGDFSTLDGVSANYIGCWDGSNWNKLPTEPNKLVRTIKETNDGIYIGGSFTEVGILEASGIARWNGSSWEVPNQKLETFSFIGNIILDINEYKGEILVSGLFDNSDTKILNGILSLNSNLEISTFNGINTGLGVNGIIYSLIEDGSDVYAAGQFLSAGNTITNNIAKWNGASWENLADGVNGPIFSLLLDGNNLYVGGDFTKAGTVPTDNIAKYNTSTNTWSAVGDGVNGQVIDILKVGSKIYVAGNFSQAGSTSADNIAVWNGSTWDALGSGLPGSAVHTMAVMQSKIIAGGDFTSGSLENIAAWDGSSWTQLNDGVDGVVNGLEVVGDSLLYVGGDFSTVDNNTVNAKNIATWNGSTWKPVGLGFDYDVESILFKNNTIYAVGAFGNSGISEISGVATWNGTTWESLGSGLTDKVGSEYVSSLAITSDDKLYIGGLFHDVGSKPASAISAYDLSETPISNENMSEIATDFSLEQNYPNPFNPSTNISFKVPAQSPVSLKVYNMLGQEVATLVNEVKAAGSYTVNFDATNLANGMYIYRLTALNTSITKKMTLIK